MSSSKFKIDKLVVHKGATVVIGDHNRVQVYVDALQRAALNVRDPRATRERLEELQRQVEAAPEQGEIHLSSGKKTEITKLLVSLLEELNRPPEAQDRPKVQQWLEHVKETLRSLPTALEIAKTLMGLLGY